MALSLSSLRRTSETQKPPRCVVYGPPGVGKSTFAAGAPSPVFIQTEEGLEAINAEAFPLAKTFDDVLEAIGVLANEEHSFKTVVLDSLDWCERLIWTKVAQAAGGKNIEDIPYGKGYKQALDQWRSLMDGIDYLRDSKGMQFIGVAHCKIKRFDDPLHDPYDRYMLDMHDSASAILIEWSDIIGFASYRYSTTQADVGFNSKVTRAVGTGERVLYTQERPGWTAKSRWRLPNTMKLEYAAFEAALTAAMTAAVQPPIANAA